MDKERLPPNCAIITQSLNLASYGIVYSEKPIDSYVIAESQESQFLLIASAIHAAPKPLSIFTTATPGAQLFNMPRRAAIPPKLAP